jgi:putative inorganic carbon (hco3(-)) transporter
MAKVGRGPAHSPVSAAGSPRGRTFAGVPVQRWDLLLVCTAVFLITAAARVHTLFSPLQALRPTLIAAVIALGVYLLSQRPFIRSTRAINHPIAYLALFVIVWAGLGVPFALYGGRAASFLLDVFYRVVILAFLLAVVVRDLNDVRRMLAVYAVGAVVFSVFASSSALRGLRGGGYDPNDAAMFLVSALPAVIYFAVRARSPRVRLLFVGGLLLCCGAIVTSGSRGGFLALLAVLAYLLIFFRGVSARVRLTAVFGIFAAVAFYADGAYWERMRSIAEFDDGYGESGPGGRMQIWKRGMGYMVDNPLLGVGINNFTVAEGQHPRIRGRIERGLGTKYSAPHSIWVQVGAELGIPGFLAFIGIFVVAGFSLWRLTLAGGRRSRAPPAREGGALASVILGMLLGLAVGGSFLSQAYYSPLWAVIGLTLGLLKVMRAQGLAPGAPRSRRRPLTAGHALPRPASAGRATLR